MYDEFGGILPEMDRAAVALLTLTPLSKPEACDDNESRHMLEAASAGSVKACSLNTEQSAVSLFQQ